MALRRLAFRARSVSSDCAEARPPRDDIESATNASSACSGGALGGACETKGPNQADYWLRQTLGAKPWNRLNARLNASSESYPTRCAIATIVDSVVASISWAMCIRQSVR